MYIKNASYKNSKSFFGKLIRFKQRYLMNLPKRYARNSHTEVVFCFTDDKDILKLLNKIEVIYFGKDNVRIEGNLRKEYFKKYNLWFSSSEEDRGVRFKFIEDNKNHWTYKKFEVEKQEYIKMLKFAISQEGNAYNWLGIFFDQGLGIKWFRRQGDWFCSQIATATYQQIKKLCGVNAIDETPGTLASKI